jgi:GNAT superfamily N-acetyltransferase
MSVEIREEPIGALAEHARIPIAFEVRRVLDVRLQGDGLRGVSLVETPVAEPWIKDYDADPEAAPARWAERFDLRNWGLLSAWDGAERVGGAVIAFDTPGVIMLGGRRDLAVLWDVRVSPRRRRAGVGSSLFRAVEAWARARGCVRLDVETQNVNVAACRFYARMGCVLRAIDRFAYPELPGEVELLWTRRLA